MPPPHSTLHFVNLSRPNEGKDEETRRAVRTHVMQQYIHKKKLRDKRRVTKRIASEAVPRLSCTCPGTQASDKPSNLSAGESVVCPTCHGLRWVRTESAVDRNSGQPSREHLAVTRYTTRRRRSDAHPVTTLGAGRVDPFRVYPVEAQPYMHDLLDHYFVLLGQALVPAQVTGQQSPILTKWMRLALRCPALFYGTLLVSSYHYAETREDKRDETSALVTRGQAIRALNEALADPVQATSDDNIAAVINLAGHELLVGNLLFYKCHMIGLEKMIAMRGGLQTLGLDGLTEALVHWVDQLGVILTGSKPRFPPAPILTVVRQTLPTDSGSLGPVSTSSSAKVSDLPLPVNNGGTGHHPTHTELEHRTTSAPKPNTNRSLDHPLPPTMTEEGPLSFPTPDRLKRDEVTAMLEVGRFASIVYPKRRWRGFTNYAP